MGSATGWPREALAETARDARLPRLPQGKARALRVLRGMVGVAVSAPDDFNITIECIRKDGTMWFRTLIDGVETHDEDTTRALLRRVMFGLIQFSARLSNEDVDAILSTDDDEEGEAP